MTTSNEKTTVPDGPGVQEGSTWRNAWWLAGKELQRTWPSYLATAFTWLVFSFIVSSSFGTVLSPETVSGNGREAVFLDLLFLILLANVSLNWMSKGYFYIWRDPFVERLSFLRSLPVSARDLVASRALTMLLTAVAMTTLFFAPPYLLWATGPVSVQVGPVQYLWFVLMWLGYGLFSGGIALILELGFHGKTVFLIQTCWFTLLIILFAVEAGLGLWLVTDTVELVQAYGPLPAILALLLGGAAFILWTRAAVRRIERRDLAA